MFLGDGTVEEENEREENRCGKSSWDTGIEENFVSS